MQGFIPAADRRYRPVYPFRGRLCGQSHEQKSKVTGPPKHDIQPIQSLPARYPYRKAQTIDKPLEIGVCSYIQELEVERGWNSIISISGPKGRELNSTFMRDEKYSEGKQGDGPSFRSPLICSSEASFNSFFYCKCHPIAFMDKHDTIILLIHWQMVYFCR